MSVGVKTHIDAALATLPTEEQIRARVAENLREAADLRKLRRRVTPGWR